MPRGRRSPENPSDVDVKVSKPENEEHTMIHLTIGRRAALTKTIVAAVAISDCTKFDGSWGNSRARGGGGGVRQQGISADTRADSLARELARLKTVSAEKDSALAQVRETQDVIDAISRELSSIPGMDSRRIVVGGNENQPANIQQLIAEKITRARQLVEQSDATIREREQRITALLGENDSLKTEATKFRESIETMLGMIDKQRAELERLTARVAELESAQEQLKRENSELSDSVGALRARENAVYVAVGTESELLRAGVVTRAGGANMGFWRPGQTLVPAKNPPRNAFRSLDMSQVREIDLPDAAWYRIVSNHNPEFLSRARGDVVRGQLEIRDAEHFWEASRFLILVRAD